MLFGRVDIREAFAWKWILHIFELWSGLKINYEKSQIYFMGEQMLITLWKVLGCPRREFLIKYLRLPLKETKLRKEYWIGTKEKIKKKKKLEGRRVDLSHWESE